MGIPIFHISSSLVFYDSVGKTGSVSARAFDQGMSIIWIVEIIYLIDYSFGRLAECASDSRVV
jgi:hypothetical protein